MTKPPKEWKAKAEAIREKLVAELVRINSLNAALAMAIRRNDYQMYLEFLMSTDAQEREP